MLSATGKLITKLNDLLDTVSEDKAHSFLSWSVKKAELEFGADPSFTFPLFRKGIYWAEYGENIGSEENKHRPVVFLWTSKDSPIAVVVPLTTQRLEINISSTLIWSNSIIPH